MEGPCAGMADCAILAQARHCEWGLMLLAVMRAGYRQERLLYMQSSQQCLVGSRQGAQDGLYHWPRSSRSTSSLIACVACRIRTQAIIRSICGAGQSLQMTSERHLKVVEKVSQAESSLPENLDTAWLPMHDACMLPAL